MADPIHKETVLDSLRSVNDPDLGKDIVSLGLVKEVDVHDGVVRVEIEIPMPIFPSRDSFRAAVADKVRSAGAEKVEVAVTSVIRGYRPPDRQDVLKEIKNVVAVASGKGGVGKSTLAVNLALAFARTGASVGMLDADVYGPSLGIMLGIEGRPTITDNEKMAPLEAQGLKVMSISFLTTKDTPVIWRGPMVHGLVSQFLSQVEWGELDYLVIDLPPGTGDAQLTLTQQAPLAGAVIITTPQDVSLVDARRGLKMFDQVKVPVLGIVENMSFFLCPHCGGRTDIFRHGGGQKTSIELGVPFLGEVPIDADVVAGGDAGTPIVAAKPDSPAARAYTHVAERVAAGLARLALQEGGDSKSLFMEW